MAILLNLVKFMNCPEKQVKKALQSKCCRFSAKPGDRCAYAGEETHVDVGGHQDCHPVELQARW